MSRCVYALSSHFNPRSPHGERRSPRAEFPAEVHISIHAPRTGSDKKSIFLTWEYQISIHAPRTGSDTRLMRAGSGPSHFNPRSPHGERPFRLLILDIWRYDFNPRSPHGERLPLLHSSCRENQHFNPRSPHGERHRTPRKTRLHKKFQSTLPARGATCAGLPQRNQATYFNPRSPHGERPSPCPCA